MDDPAMRPDGANRIYGFWHLHMGTAMGIGTISEMLDQGTLNGKRCGIALENQGKSPF